MNLFTQLRPDAHATPPERLLEGPVTVLKAVDAPRAAVLAAVLGVRTVREMAGQPLVDWVWRTYRLFRAGAQRELPRQAESHVTEAWQGRACGEWLASSLGSLAGLESEDVQRLADGLGWVTVRHMATDAAFAAAREISRIVTGEPVAPEETVTRPAPDYFGGGTQRFRDRAREEAGRPRRPPPPPPPPPTPPAPPRAAPELALEGDAAPAVRATLYPNAAGSMPAGPRHMHKDYTPSGAYIPKGGGSRGWLENQGVARAERPNRYRYHEVVDAVGFKRARPEDAVRINNRGTDRKDLRMQVRWAENAEAVPTPGLCLNVSHSGAKLRIGQALRQDTPVHLTWVHRDDLLGDEQPLLTLTARAVWCQSVNPNYRNPRFDCGVHFDPIELDAQERLTLLLTDRIGELLRADEGPQPFTR